MKKLYLFTLITVSLCATVGCKKDLPFPLDEVKRGVVVDITRVPGTDGVLSAGQIAGDYKVKLTIPQYQGDYSFLDHAQLLAVLETATGISSRVAVDNITTFPQEITVDLADVYSKFGLSSPSLGEILYFTANVVLTNGEVIPGWTEYAGFNNQAFAGWQVDNRAYSYNVRYAVACPFNPDPFTGTFIGTFNCTETSSFGNDAYTVTLSAHTGLPPTIPAGVDASKLYGVDITPISPNVWEPAIDNIKIWINTEDFSLVIPDQDTGDTYNGNPILWAKFRSTSISTCNRTIQFTTDAFVPALNGGWSGFSFTITP
jgi:hypothetical protein